MARESDLVCKKCGNAQKPGEYCEACGTPWETIVGSGAQIAPDTSGSQPTSHRSISVPVDLVICLVAVVVGALISRATELISPFFLTLLLALGYAFLVRKWLRLTRGIPGSRLVGACILASLLAVISLFTWLVGKETPAYLFVIALCLAVILAAAAWYVREHAKRVIREEQLLTYTEKLPTGAGGGGRSAVTVTDPPLASSLPELVTMLDRGLLTLEEFQVAKRRMLATGPQGDDDER